MRAILIPAALSLAVAAAWPLSSAQAAGCLKGAVVGGVAGHLAHHGVLGAVAGCAIGHHEASKHAKHVREVNGNNGTAEHGTHR